MRGGWRKRSDSEFGMGRTHGMTGSPEFSSWRSMIKRCTNESHDSYQRYGGRGIVVCDRWLESFACFYADMGPRPSIRHSIEREDSNGNYEPGNCRWATPTEQCRNRCNNRLVELNGKIMTVTEAADLVGICRNTIYSRLYHGWSIEKAISKPPQRRRTNASRRR